jgi:predicted membrane protein
MGFLRVLLVLVIVYYLFKFLIRIFLPLFLTHRIKKMAEEKERAQKDFVERQKRDAGKVTVNYIPPKEGNKETSDGEYIDFEEVK